MLVLQNSTTARKSGNILDVLKSFSSSDTHQSMKRRIATFHTLMGVGQKGLLVRLTMLAFFQAVVILHNSHSMIWDDAICCSYDERLVSFIDEKDHRK